MYIMKSRKVLPFISQEGVGTGPVAIGLHFWVSHSTEGQAFAIRTSNKEGVRAIREAQIFRGEDECRVGGGE